MIKKALLLVMGIVLSGCLVTVDSDSRPLQTVWNEADVSRLQLGVSNQDWVNTSFGDPITKLNYVARMGRNYTQAKQELKKANERLEVSQLSNFQLKIPGFFPVISAASVSEYWLFMLR